MGLDSSVYVGPYVRFTNSIISSKTVVGKPYKACPVHSKIPVLHDAKFCHKCGAAIEQLLNEEQEHTRVLDLVIQTLGNTENVFFDRYLNIQGHVDDYKENEFFFISQDSPHDIPTERGQSSIFDLDLDQIKLMYDPKCKSYSRMYDLIKVLTQLEIKHESNVGYIQYWS